MTGGVTLAYQVHGAPGAAPMVLLHGGNADGSAWDAVVGGLAESWHVYVLDLRGHGASDRPGSYSFELMRDDVIGFLDALSLSGVALVAPEPMGFTVPEHEIRGPIVRQLNAPDPAWRDAVAAITCPVVVIGGGPASFLPQNRIAAMAARFPRGGLVTIPVGHHVHRDAPDAFLEAVRDLP
ncbi:hypothetical protein CS0771_39370 [Catellatospora sp. IY07-71]|nr:hypothetical protein CS0771_39370 [Catellatospora sp. IY07-71]